MTKLLCNVFYVNQRMLSLCRTRVGIGNLQGMWKMAAYVCHYNLCTGNLTLADGLLKRGLALQAHGGTFDVVCIVAFIGLQ